MCRRIRRLIGAVAFSALVLLATSTAAEDVDAFKGKTINLYIGFSAGGYDSYGRALARHIGKHIPGRPNVVAINMPGAGSMKLAYWLAEAAPRDGTAIGLVDRGLFIKPLLEQTNRAIDFSRLNWIGSISHETLLCVSRAGSQVRSFSDLTKYELAAGGLGKADISYTSVALLRNMFRAKIKFVAGYPGGNDLTLALDRGEIDGRCAWSLSSIRSSRPTWLTDRKINLLTQYTTTRSAELPDVPSLVEFAKSDRDRAIIEFLYTSEAAARPFAAPPDVSADRLKILRDAFDATMKDSEFIAEAHKIGLDVNPMTGQRVADLLSRVYTTPSELMSAAANMVK